jgi:phosphate starvation-inducible PhoH-like protein
MSRKAKQTDVVADDNKATIPSFKVTLKCKNAKQKELVRAIQDNQITVCKGVFGVGKSYVIGATALRLLQVQPNLDKIICITPTVEVGDMHLGLMPGDFNEKMSFHIINEIDCFNKIIHDSGNNKADAIVDDMLKKGIIEFRPISNLRGASFRNSLILVSEAEEFTKEELFLILTRYESGKMIISGDPLQSSRKIVKHDSGLLHACKVLKNMDNVKVVEFSDEDIVRNDILLDIYKRWKDDTTSNI